LEKDKMKQRILISGAAGFVGHQVVDYFLKNTSFDLVLLDGLTYAGSLERITSLESYNPNRVRFVYHNLRSPINNLVSEKIGEVDFILHLAANSSVEYTIDHPIESVYDNVLGTVHMLEFARTQKNLKMMNYFSTDEVYGPASEGVNFDENAPHRPSNPYSAGKAAGEDYCHAYFTTYRLPVFITNTMNCIGPDQHPEKYIPTVVRCIMKDETLKVYSDKEKTKAGSRFWIFVPDVANALTFLLLNAKAGERYNIVGIEKDNLELAKEMAKIAGKELKYEMVDFHSSRPGHDLRYGMSGEKLAKMGWKSTTSSFNESLKKTVEWYMKKYEDSSTE
jgi:dTDP-glucose 4,6-dehydratase